MSLGGAKRVCERERWRDEGGGIAAGITELQNPQRERHTVTERDRSILKTASLSFRQNDSEQNRVERRTE